jgi:hypothetical protein
MYLCLNQTGNKCCDYTVNDKSRQCNYEERSGASYLDCRYCKKVEDLKPCPFCGGNAKLNYLNTISSYAVDCENDCCTLNQPELTREQAIKLWNKRI